LDCLKHSDLESHLDELGRRVPLRRLIRPLSSLIRSDDEAAKYRAVAALGWVTARLAESDLEAGRDVVRRLMLTLTEESGGIGWGSPEAIGEILARHEGLAVEFAPILASYADPECDNYLEHVPLQRGVLWGLARLAETRPRLLLRQGIPGRLRSHLASQDPTTRGLAAWVACLLGADEDRVPGWSALQKDEAPVRIYHDGRPIDCRVMDLARFNG